MYYLIYFGEDGIRITQHTHHEVQNIVNNAAEDNYKFLEEVPEGGLSMDLGEYPIYKYLIIQGEIKVPQAVEIVKKYKL
jgi:hypothetical protein